MDPRLTSLALESVPAELHRRADAARLAAAMRRGNRDARGSFAGLRGHRWAIRRLSSGSVSRTPARRETALQDAG